MTSHWFLPVEKQTQHNILDPCRERERAHDKFQLISYNKRRRYSIEWGSIFPSGPVSRAKESYFRSSSKRKKKFWPHNSFAQNGIWCPCAVLHYAFFFLLQWFFSIHSMDEEKLRWISSLSLSPLFHSSLNSPTETTRAEILLNRKEEAEWYGPGHKKSIHAILEEGGGRESRHRPPPRRRWFSGNKREKKTF